MHLDTHAVIWLYAGDLRRFPAAARELLEAEALAVSPMVALELQYLSEVGRVTEGPGGILADLRERVGLQELDCSFAKVVRRAAQLTWTRDPFDRLIVGHAEAESALLLTADTTIGAHSEAARWE